MFDKELALEILIQVRQAAETVLRRFKPIKSPEDFTGSDIGMEKLDAVWHLLSQSVARSTPT